MKHRCIFCPVQVLHASRLDPGHSASQTRVNALVVGRDDSRGSPPDSAGLLNQADFSFILPLGEKDDRQTLTRLFPDIALFHPDILRDDWIIVRHVFGGIG